MRYLYVIMLLVVLLFLSYHNSDTTHYSYPTHNEGSWSEAPDAKQSEGSR